MSRKSVCLAIFSSLLMGQLSAANLADKMASLSLPEGFTLSLLSDQVPNARQMVLSEQGILYVGSRREGKVYAVMPSQGTGDNAVIVIAKNLASPSGVAMLDGDLYVGAVDQILVFSNIDVLLQQSPGDKLKPRVVSKDLPDKAHHGLKTLSFGPDNYLYVSVGVPCNICLPDDPVFGTIQRMHPGTGEKSTYAKGIRNTVGLAWHPDSGNLWFSDNGRDRLGDDIPADEINEITRDNAHYGYPYLHAGDIADPEYGKGKKAGDYIQPIHKIQAHSAALGISFYTGRQFPERYHNALFIAEHGSWNRGEKVGYQVAVLRWEAGQKTYEPFITGWLDEDKNWGRPNGVLVTPDGDLLVSDDQAGAIYRISYPR